MNKEMLSIEYDDDDKDLSGFIKFFNGNTNNQKKQLLNEIIGDGERYLSEMERNKTNRKQKLKKKIKYIFCKTNEYTLDELNGLDYNDVVEIYEEIKERNKPIIFKLFRFLFFGY